MHIFFVTYLAIHVVLFFFLKKKKKEKPRKIPVQSNVVLKHSMFPRATIRNKCSGSLGWRYGSKLEVLLREQGTSSSAGHCKVECYSSLCKQNATFQCRTAGILRTQWGRRLRRHMTCDNRHLWRHRSDGAELTYPLTCIYTQTITPPIPLHPYLNGLSPISLSRAVARHQWPELILHQIWEGQQYPARVNYLHNQNRGLLPPH